MTFHRSLYIKSAHRHALAAFTLIELLVVVSIVVLLISLLLPALSTARETARRAGCSSNLRQWSIGLAAYAGDFKNWLPSKNSSGVLSTPGQVMDRAMESMHLYYGISPGIAGCPTDPDTGTLVNAWTGGTRSFRYYYMGGANNSTNTSSGPWHGWELWASSVGWVNGGHPVPQLDMTTAYTVQTRINPVGSAPTQNPVPFVPSKAGLMTDPVVARNRPVLHTATGSGPTISSAADWVQHPEIQGGNAMYADGHGRFVPATQEFLKHSRSSVNRVFW